MLIRRALKSDKAALAFLEVECFDDPWTEDMYAEVLEEEFSHYFVLEIEGIIAGVCGFYQVLDEGHITNIAVLPGYRGKGYGRFLTETLISEGEKLGLIALTLEVRVSNLAAIALYQKLGFVSVGIRPKYYSNGENAFIMWRRKQ